MTEQRRGRLIIPPTDEMLKKRLALKLKEYQERMAGKGRPWEYTHPELAHSLYEGYRDSCYKTYILKAVLESNEPVDAWKLSRELFAQWKSSFNFNDFCVACGVIDKYCGNLPADEPPIGGTGLPKLTELEDSEQNSE